MKVAIVEFGSGNIKSVCNALNYIGCEFFISCNKNKLKESSHIILPGVGSFGGTISALEQRNLVKILKDLVVSDGRYYLGICVGMQILANKGNPLCKLNERMFNMV